MKLRVLRIKVIIFEIIKINLWIKLFFFKDIKNNWSYTTFSNYNQLINLERCLLIRRDIFWGNNLIKN